MSCRQTTRFTQGCPLETAEDQLAPEAPLEIRVRGRPISVTMRTPGQDGDLAAGFLLTEGVIHSPSGHRQAGDPRRGPVGTTWSTCFCAPAFGWTSSV